MFLFDPMDRDNRQLFWLQQGKCEAHRFIGSIKKGGCRDISCEHCILSPVNIAKFKEKYG